MDDATLALALRWLQVIGVIGAGIGALFTFAKGVHEYTIKVRLQRYQQYAAKIKEFENSPNLMDVYKRVLARDAHLSDVDVWDRIAYLVFLEDLGVMMNSDLLSKYIVHNSWSDGIIRCWDDDNFWHDIPRDGSSWRTFRVLAQDMKKIDRILEKNPDFMARRAF
jgi:hypothetical protein